MTIKCLDCKHFFETNDTICCNYHKVGFKYDGNRTLNISKLSKKCSEKDNRVSEFGGPITEDLLKKFEPVYKDTSKPVKDLMKEHMITSAKWGRMAREIQKRTGYKRPRYDSTVEHRYITKRKGAKRDYYIVKHNNKYYGSYISYKRAQLARNLLEAYEWDMRFVPYVRKRVDDYCDNLENKDGEI